MWRPRYVPTNSITRLSTSTCRYAVSSLKLGRPTRGSALRISGTSSPVAQRCISMSCLSRAGRIVRRSSALVKGSKRMGDYDAAVEGTPEQLAELRRRLDDDLDSRTVVAFAATLGVLPPAQPEGWQGWEIVDTFANEDYDNPIMYWLGPHPDHGGEVHPAEGSPDTAERGESGGAHH